MANKKFEEYGFKPSAVIAGLNRWYEAKDERALIWFADPDAWPNHYFYDHDKTIDDAIKYLRSMDIFYTPGMKWDDVKFKLSTDACLREYGYPDIHSAWPKVYPTSLNYTNIYDFAETKKKFGQWKTERDRAERDKEIRDYILKRANEAGIKIYIRDESPEDLIYYLMSLLVRDRNTAKVERERADGYLEKIDRLQKELDNWNCWYTDKEHYIK